MNMKIVLFLTLFCTFSAKINAQYLDLCSDTNYYDTDTGNVEARYTFYYLHRYLQKSDIDRINYYAQLLHNPPAIHLSAGTKDTILLNNFIVDFFGYMMQKDIESKTNISFNNAVDSRFPGYYCNDSKSLDSLVKLSKTAINSGYYGQKKIFVDRTRYAMYDYYPSFLFPYFENSIENRIQFVEKFYLGMDSLLLEVVKLDIDTLLSINTSLDHKHLDNSVLCIIDLWKRKLNDQGGYEKQTPP